MPLFAPVINAILFDELCMAFLSAVDIRRWFG